MRRLQLISVLDRPSAVRLVPFLLLVACARGGPGPVVTAILEPQSPAIRENRLVEPVGFETLGGILTPVLKPCTTPCETTEIFSTATDNQSQISLIVLRGRTGVASEGHRLGTFLIQSIPPGPRAVPQIAVTLRADAGDLIVAVRDLGGASVTVVRAQ
jgi:molecular chaperone DnaK (HSP70)